MKFELAWADVLARNNLLKVFAGLTTILSVVLSVGLVRAATREPIVVERECSTLIANLGDAKHSENEIRDFVEQAIESRFDHRFHFASTLFTKELAAGYQSEEEQYKRRGIQQTLVVNQVIVEGAEVTVDADRIVTMGKVRAVLKFSLKLKIAKVPRSNFNPWGLIIENIEVIKDENEEKTN